MGEPLFLGVVVGCGIGALACKNSQELVDGIPAILGLGIKMGAVMELIPRITSLFIELVTRLRWWFLCCLFP